MKEKKTMGKCSIRKHQEENEVEIDKTNFNAL